MVKKTKTKTASTKDPKDKKGSKGKTQVTGEKDIRAALAELEEGWGEIEAPSYGDIPDGKYQVQIDEDSSINKSQSSGRLQVSWKMSIMSGEHKGRKLFKHDGLDDETSLGYFKSGLARLGAEWPDSPTDLPEVIAELAGSFCQVTVKHKEGSDFTNVYFDKALDSDDIEESDDEEEGEEEADTEESDEGDSDDDDADEAGGEDTEEEEAQAPSVGDRVSVMYGDEAFEGKITKVNAKKEVAMIKFDDGEIAEHGFDVIEMVDSEEEEEEEEGEEETEEEGEEESEASVEAEFEDEAIDKATQKTIRLLAKKHDFKANDYESSKDLLCDIAEHVGVVGTFKKPAALLAAISKKNAK